MRERIATPSGITLSYTKDGSGPPLVLVHGAFSDDVSNWEFVKPILEQRFTLYAVARRGRGDTAATERHSLEDEAKDVAALINIIDEPVFLLGHSYGAHTALLAATFVPGRVRKLILYEPAWPHLISPEAMVRNEQLASERDWDNFAYTFFRDSLHVPPSELDPVRASGLWAPIVNDGPATLGDLRALSKYEFDAARFRDLNIPVLLQVGTESVHELYVTEALAEVLPDSHIEQLQGQAHEGMTTAPEQYAESVTKFLLGRAQEAGN